MMDQRERDLYNRQIKHLENLNRILLENFATYDCNTPRQIVIEKADITPIVKQELHQLRVHLQEIEWGGRFTDDDDCEYNCCPACDAIPDKDEGHASDCWLKFQIDQLEAIKE